MAGRRPKLIPLRESCLRREIRVCGRGQLLWPFYYYYITNTYVINTHTHKHTRVWEHIVRIIVWRAQNYCNINFTYICNIYMPWVRRPAAARAYTRVVCVKSVSADVSTTWGLEKSHEIQKQIRVRKYSLWLLYWCMKQVTLFCALSELKWNSSQKPAEQKWIRNGFMIFLLHLDTSVRVVKYCGNFRWQISYGINIE